MFLTERLPVVHSLTDGVPGNLTEVPKIPTENTQNREILPCFLCFLLKSQNFAVKSGVTPPPIGYLSRGMPTFMSYSVRSNINGDSSIHGKS